MTDIATAPAPVPSIHSSRELIALEDRYGAHNYHPLDVVVERAEGAYVWDVEGRRYLDGLAAYSAVNQGHCHPRIVQALVEQAGRVTLTSRAFRNARLGELYRAVCELTGYPRALPMNTGAEAVETAIKAARKWAMEVKGLADGEAEILVFDGNFHGRTTTIVGFSSEEQYRRGFGPFGPGFRRLPYGDAAAVERAMHEKVAAILFEPIQGEAGIVIPPDGFVRRLRELCDDHRALLIADEIQSGLGRTGRILACEHEGVRPDVVVLGKALSGGVYPVSVMLADDEVMDVFRPGDHGSTYGGNPLAAAVGVAALGVLVDEGLCQRSARLGAAALERLRAARLPGVREVRGRGLWIGIELEASRGGARAVCERLRERGLLCKETHQHVIRFAPPLVIAEDDLEWALDQIEETLRE
ncbi:MAG TPA: ornithine--oxo-acid transaminase [Thermoanaerobaculia bacterium]|nr:ornithine--oxo-acid transaminase [Thermoanaerobaculia bacterium]